MIEARAVLSIWALPTWAGKAWLVSLSQERHLSTNGYTDDDGDDDIDLFVLLCLIRELAARTCFVNVGVLCC